MNTGIQHDFRKAILICVYLSTCLNVSTSEVPDGFQCPAVVNYAETEEETLHFGLKERKSLFYMKTILTSSFF